MKKFFLEKIVENAEKGTVPKPEELKEIFGYDGADLNPLFEKAREKAFSAYSGSVFVRGLIEITSFCKNDCLYCGLRRSNGKAQRYRISEEEIFEICKDGYKKGLRTFVLQGGEDGYFNDERLVPLIEKIKSAFKDAAVTLSLGERTRESYEKLFAAGVDRYLLRHETADIEHYKKLHPKDMDFDNRLRCLYDLKKIGYQTGCGFMTGSPYQTEETVYKDLLFIKEFEPEMVGIGPFIPHSETPFKDFEKGSVKKTLILLALVRILVPYVLLPATTALKTADGNGLLKGILAGANVIMPNITPKKFRAKYEIYDGKSTSDNTSLENYLEKFDAKLEKTGRKLDLSRGDFKNPNEKNIYRI